MRVVTLEEHVVFPEMVNQLPAEKRESGAVDYLSDKLSDIGGERLQSMDKNGITVQVLSVVGPNAGLLNADEAPAFATEYNDLLAQKISGHPDRFAALAHLPMANPEASAKELERTVKELNFKGAMINGLTHGAFLDDEQFAPVLQKAESLDVPIYLHPGMPPKAVIDAYYSGLPKDSGGLLSIAGWGWHSETAIHILRMVVAGTFDLYPKLKIIIGHMGEMLPMMMVRSDKVFGTNRAGDNQRSLIETLRSQVYVTTSGLFTQPPFRILLDTFGIDNTLFSVDYPFSGNEIGKQFLDEISLSDTDLAKLTHGNADRLLKL